MDAYDIGQVKITAMVEEGAEPCYTAEAVGLSAAGASISECLTQLAAQIKERDLTNTPLNFPLPGEPGGPQYAEETFVPSDVVERVRRHGLDMMAEHVSQPDQVQAVAHHAPTLLVFLCATLLDLHARQPDSPWFALGCHLLKTFDIKTAKAIRGFGDTFMDELKSVRPVNADGSEKS